MRFNNAGIVGFDAVADETVAGFQRVMDLNLLGVLLGVESAIPSLKRAGGGAIVTISSTVRTMAYGNSGHVASKRAARPHQVRCLADATFSTGSEFVVGGGALLGPLNRVTDPD